MSGFAYADLDQMRGWAAGVMSRVPDFIIGPVENPYLRRWWVIPRNEGCNVYLHETLRGDDDLVGHDHPWHNTSYLIDGAYEEVTYYRDQPWIEAYRYVRTAGETVNRRATDTHRLIVPEGGRSVSLFITGPKIREWGFWCPEGERWVHWRAFTAGEHGELVGRGCD